MRNHLEEYYNNIKSSLLDILGQSLNLCMLIWSEERKEDKNKIIIDTYKISFILLFFSFLESFINSISDLCLEFNKINSDNNNFLNLSQIEIDYLKEKQSYLDKNGELKDNIKYVPIEDKMFLYPKILSKLFKVDFNIDKSSLYWQYLKRFKDIRNNLTHRKDNSLNNYKRDKNINFSNFKDMKKLNGSYFEDKDFYKIVVGVRWYYNEIDLLLTQNNEIDFIDSFLFLMEVYFYNYSGNTFKSINKNIKKPRGSELNFNYDEFFKYDLRLANFD